MNKYKKIADTGGELFIYGIIIGLFFSNALKSISLVALAASILVHPETKKTLLLLRKNSLYLLTACIALIYISSVFHGGNYKDYLKMSQLKWLYLFIPVAIYNIDFSKIFLMSILWIACLCALAQSIYSIIFYLEHGKVYVEQMYSVGKFLPTYKIHTHQISILFAFLCAGILYGISNQLLNRLQSICMGLVFVFLTIMIHIYSVRSAMVVYYLFCLAFVLVFFSKKSSVLKFGMVAAVVSIIAVFWMKSPILKNRMDYLRYDRAQLDTHKKDVLNYSDGKRMVSYKCGWQLFKKNIWFGVGLGNISEACRQEVKTSFPDLIGEIDILPHSQYIFSLSAFGILLGGAVIIALLLNGIILVSKKEYFISLLYSAILIWCIWDIVLGTLFGNSLYILLISAGIKKINVESSTY